MSAAKTRRVTLERVIESYFKEQVEKNGGMCEKFVSPGTKGVPDRIVTWPAPGFSRIHFVELKAPLGKLDPCQVRDHARRKRLGCHVFVLYTKRQVDDYIERFAVPPF